MAAVDGSPREARNRTVAAPAVGVPPAVGGGPSGRRVAGGPKRVVMTVDALQRVHGDRDAMAALLAALGWRGSLADWIEMLARMEGIGADTRHFRTTASQLFLLELDSSNDRLRPAETRVLDAVKTANRLWRDRTGRPLIGVVPG